MQIMVHSVTPEAVELIGCTGLPSYPIQFSSTGMSGTARFVPSDDDVQNCVGKSVDVEINQDYVSDITKELREARTISVVALPEPFTFRVCGVVSLVSPVSEPPDGEIVYVNAGDATFSFLQSGSVKGKVNQGETISFIAHNVSLWDAAI